MTDIRPYDVFLSHSSADKDAVEAIARRLEDEAALHPFLDKWHLIPGNPWQEELEQALNQSRTCAVFLGPADLGSWENEEMRLALDKRTRHPNFRVIPVLLPNTHMPEKGPLPDFLRRVTWVDFRGGLDDADAFHRLVSGIKGIAPGQAVPTPDRSSLPPDADVCPYLGLETFQEKDTDFFFGRAALTQWLGERLRERRFLAVIGPSGSGKSSVVRAGLIPALRQGALPGSSNWQTVIMTPTERPLEELAARLALLTEPASRARRMRQLQDDLRADKRTLHTEARMELAEGNASARLLIVVDQFEELFTLCRDDQERSQFLDNLLYAATISQGQIVVVIAMRADFYGRSAAHAQLADCMSENQVTITPMDEHELTEAIELPARKVGLSFEAGLVDTIRDDVLGQPGGLPLLEHALRELWERRRGDQVLTLQAYRALGGVRGALAQKADTLFMSLSPPQQTIARRVFLRLTQPGEGTEDTRRRATMGELQTTAEDAEMVAAVVQRLADARLLVMGENQQVDVAHEALIRGWPRLRGWIEADRTALRTHRRITEAAEEWQRLDHDAGVLFRGALLTVAHEWREQHAEDLNVLEQAFLEASVARQHQEEAQERQRLADEQAHLRALADAQRQRAEEHALAAKRLRGVVVVLCCVALVALGAWLIARNQWQRANTTLVKNYWISAVKAQTEGDWLRAAHFFARVGVLTSDLSEVKNAILALHHPLQTFLLSFQRAHNVAIDGIVRSQDERFILSWGGDETLRLWQVSDGAAIRVMKPEESSSWVRGATFNRDESRILSWDSEGTLRLWQASDGTAIRVMKPEESSFWVQVQGATFNHDGSRILSWDSEGTLRLWQVSDGAAIRVMKPEGNSSGVQGAMFNRDESRILSWDSEGTLWLWQASDGAAIRVMKPEGHGPKGPGAMFNHDGSRILSWDSEGTLRLWQASDGTAIRVMKPEESSFWVQVQGATFNHDGSRILSWGSEGTLWLWQVSDGAAIRVMKPEESSSGVRGATFNRDESRILSWDSEGTLRLWQVSDGAAIRVMKPEGNSSGVRGATFNRDESRILSWDSEGTLRLWQVSDGAAIRVMKPEGNSSGVQGATFNHDESRILSWGGEGTLRLWQVSDGAAIRVMKPEWGGFGHQGAMFNRDESRILSWDNDGTLWLWQVSDGAVIRVMKHERGNLGHQGATFNHDGSRILSWGGDGTLRLWQVSDGAAIRVMKHERGGFGVQGAMFNRDESRILSWDNDGTLRLWQASDGAVIRVMKPEWGGFGHQGAMFNHDESRILSWDNDGTLWLWQVSDGAVIRVMKHERGNLGHQGATFNHDGSRILSWGGDGTLRLWQVSDGAAIRVMKHERGGFGVQGATFNHDESRILSWGDDGTLRLWQVSDGAALRVMKHKRGGFGLQGATFNHDESRILSWGGDGTLQLWDIQEDFDFPQEHLRLLVEVVTGTIMDDLGNISALPLEEWTKRKKQYKGIAEQHLLTCQHRDVNLYLRQKSFWTAKE